MGEGTGSEQSFAASTTEQRGLTEYEKGYCDGVLAFAYRSDGEVYVGRSKLTTYKSAIEYFLSKRGLHGYTVNVHKP